MQVKGNKLAAVFMHSCNLSTFLFIRKKWHNKEYLIWFLIRIPTLGLQFLYLCILKVIVKKTEKSPFVRFSDYY